MLGIRFKRGYTRWNFLGTFIVLLAGFTAMIYLNTQTIFLLRDPENGFGIPKEQIGRVSNELIAYVLPFQLVFSLVSGYLFDLVGRKITLFASSLLICVSMAAIPWTAPSVYPWLYIVRIFLGIAA